MVAKLQQTDLQESGIQQGELVAGESACRSHQYQNKLTRGQGHGVLDFTNHSVRVSMGPVRMLVDPASPR